MADIDMEQFINQYSFLWMVGAFVLLLALILLRGESKARNTIALIALVAGLFMTWLFLRPTQTPLTGDAQQVQALIGAGKPVLLEFQSPY
jgi:hypothetical protein